MKRLVIFDLDGTLLNTIADLGTACNEALRHYGYPTHDIAHYPRLVGNGVNRLILRALPEAEQTEENVQRLRKVFISYYNAHNCVYTAPYEGILHVLQTLEEQHIRLAVASNKYNAATQAIVQHYFPDTFDMVLGERTGVPRKPNPQIVFDILQSLNLTLTPHPSPLTPPPSPLTPADVLYIGDSDVDIQTAQAAGVDHIACAWGFCTEAQLLAHHPQHLIHYPHEILSIVETYS